MASFEFVSKVAAAVVLALALLGMTPLLPPPFSRLGEWLGFRPLTALAFGLCAVAALLWNAPGRPRLRSFLAVLTALAVIALGAWSTVRFVSGSEMASLRASADMPVSGGFHLRMALASSMGTVLLGISLLVVPVRSHRYTYPSQLLALATGVVAWFGILDHTLSPGNAHLMSAGTTLAMALMVLAVLNLRPDRGLMSVVTGDSLGGSMARRLLPAAVALSLVVGWLRWRGEQAGLYDTEVGVALSASTQLLLLVLLIWSNARSLEKADDLRRSAEQVLYQELERLRAESAARAKSGSLQ